MNAPLDPSILDMLRGSAIAPMIDRPVNEVLRDMGLPPLPDPNRLPQLPPLPDLPPLPVLDLHAIAKPLTDLAGGFGNGQLGTGPGPDPTQVLQAVGTALTTAMSLGSSALQMAMTLWQGQGAESAATKAGQASADGAALTAQSGEQKSVLGGAATSMGIGQANMAAIIAEYTATMTAAAPLLATPGGQVFLVAATIRSLTAALAQVTETKVEMLGHSARMTQAGKKHKVTAAPKPTGAGASRIDPQQLQQMMQLLPPLMSMAQTGVQAATQAGTQLTQANAQMSAAKSAAAIAAEREREPGDGAATGGSGGAAAGGGGPAGASMVPVAAPLSPFTGPIAASAGGAVSGAAAPEAASVLRASPISPAGSPGMMPLGGGAAAAARSAGDAGGGVPGNLVNAQHGDEVVGNLEGVTPPVVGATDQAPEPPPDKALTL